MAGENVFPKVTGDIAFPSDANKYLLNDIAIAPYTANGFDSSQSGGAGNDEQDHELTAISTGISGKTYAIISITGTAVTTANDGNSGKVELKIQTKDIGGAYSDSLTYKKFLEVTDSSGEGTDSNTVTNTLRWIHTLTANEKANGIQVKVFSKSTNEGSSSAASFVNVQTTVELIN